MCTLVVCTFDKIVKKWLLALPTTKLTRNLTYVNQRAGTIQLRLEAKLVRFLLLLRNNRNEQKRIRTKNDHDDNNNIKSENELA